MSVRVKAIIGIIGAAALGSWVNARVRRRSIPAAAPVEILPPTEEAVLDIDDDAAADIIRKARPALELAARLDTQPTAS